MTAALLLGLGFGAGVALLVSGLVPAHPPLAAAINRLHQPRPRGVATATASLPIRLLGRSWVGSGLGQRVGTRAAADLRIVGLSVEEHLAHRVGISLVALLWAPATAALMGAGGVSIPFPLLLWVSVALLPAGLVFPALELRARAARRRRSFRHALSSFLDIVSVSLAGGKGVEGALTDAAEIGRGWAFDELRAALLDARLLGETPWTGLARLGAEIGVAELGELAASAALAGSEGARVKASIAAKARGLRVRVLTDVESSAQSASERMSLPIVLLLVGFVFFLGYPAVVQVLAGI
jgi:Flp pilus assembly protein TadB